MIFNFLKYIKPIWYYNLKPFHDYAYFPTEEILKERGVVLEKDIDYRSLEAQNRDLAWRAFQLGFISDKPQNGIDIWKKTKLPVEDEYRFIRKNYHKVWSLYVLFFRLLTLKNPFREISGFLKSKSTKREDYSKNFVLHQEYQSFQSDLIQENPLVSVIIPTLNRYEYLKDVFKDLENQTYKNFEVIVVDQTDGFREEFYKGWNLNLNYWFQEEKALWKARNEAIKSAKGTYILMSEDDIRIPENLIEQHLKTIDFFKADVSCGVFFPKGSSIPKERSYFKYAEQFATGNALLKKGLFKKVGLYDRQFEKQRGGDGEFGLRLYTNGFKLVSNPIAYCIDVKAPQGGLRVKGGSWDAWRPKKWNAPRPVPSVLYLSRKYFGNKLSMLMMIHSVAPSIVPYQFKRNKLLKLLSVFLLPILFPLLIFQMYKSWKLATQKLNKGGIIEFL
ncbi:MAG: glycosyltransferase family 2 protein [Flavobacteriaceae bacterium]